MSNRVAVSVVALAFAAVFAFNTIAAQASPTQVGGIDIVVKKKSGGAIVAHATTGTNGSVDLGNLPMGEYELTLALPKGAPAARGITHDLEISGAAAPVKASWNFETSRVREVALSGPDTSVRYRYGLGKAGNVASVADLNATGNDRILFTADGKHHVVIVVSAQQTAGTRSRTDSKNNVQMHASPSPTPRRANSC